MESDKKELKAVHTDDLENLLRQLGRREDFIEGKVKCKFCKDLINGENIYSLLRESGTVNFICDKPDCISNFMLYKQEKN